MDEIEQIKEEPKQLGKRSSFLTVLCILSMINAVSSIFVGLIMYVATPMMSKMYEEGLLEESMEQVYSSLEGTATYDQAMESLGEAFDVFSNLNPNYYLFMAMLYAASLAGVIVMWKLRKNGLRIYAVSQCLLLINSAVYFYSIGLGSPWSDVILTLLFVAAYWLEFRKLEQQQ